MTLNTERIPIVAFDGNHQVGKGTQIHLLYTTLADRGIRPIILRGDGSRPGLGADESDPTSEWWQEFKNYVQQFENPYDAWRIGARQLLGEAAAKLTSLNDNVTSIVLFDRSRISRTQMTLKEGLPTDFESMYRNDAGDAYDDTELRKLVPDLTIYMHAPTATLLGRLSAHDPKYEFRRANITTSQETFAEALEVCQQNGENVVSIRTDQDPVDITIQVRNAILENRII